MIQIGKHPSSRFSLKPIKSGLCHSIYPVRGFAEYLDCIFVSACRPGSVPCGETGGSVEDGKRKGLLYPVAYCCDVLYVLLKIVASTFKARLAYPVTIYTIRWW
jgi:hypothetical protein